MPHWTLGALALLWAPVTWMDLDTGQEFRLTQPIELGASGPAFPEGTTLSLISREPLSIPGAPMELLGLEQIPCAHPEWTSDMEIITPLGNDERSAVGVQLDPGCQWKVYVETKDLFTPSFFARTE